MRFQETSRNNNGLTTNCSVLGTRTVRPSSLKRRHVLASLDLHSLSLSYVVIPKRRTAAFLTAKVTNTSAITPLNSQAGLTLDGTFLGNAEISRCSPDGSFDLPLEPILRSGSTTASLLSSAAPRAFSRKRTQRSSHAISSFLIQSQRQWS